MPANTCFASDKLRTFALGQLDDVQATAISDHLVQCPACEETIAGFDDTDDSFVKDIREAAAAPDDVDNPPDVLAAAMANVGNPWNSLPESPSEQHVTEAVRDYELLAQLGSGGMGTVYKAVHRKLQRVVALKLLPARRLQHRDAVGRFEREMQAIGRLDHPAIVRATDAGEVQ